MWKCSSAGCLVLSLRFQGTSPLSVSLNWMSPFQQALESGAYGVAFASCRENFIRQLEKTCYLPDIFILGTFANFHFDQQQLWCEQSSVIVARVLVERERLLLVGYGGSLYC